MTALPIAASPPVAFPLGFYREALLGCQKGFQRVVQADAHDVHV